MIMLTGARHLLRLIDSFTSRRAFYQIDEKSHLNNLEASEMRGQSCKLPYSRFPLAAVEMNTL